MPKRKAKETGTPLAGLFPDLPVLGSDGLEFNFDGLAKTLAELAQNPTNQTPFTVVVRGDWGRGKTTLLRQTKRVLDEARKRDGQSTGNEQRKVWE